MTLVEIKMIKSKKILPILILSFSLFTGCKVSQKSITNNLEYSPLTKGNTWTYQYNNSQNTLTVKIVDKDIEIDSKKYYKIQRTYSWNNQSFDYSRNENGVYYSYDDKTKGESVTIPKEIKIGSTWKQYDESWEYEIMGINESLKTPIMSYTGLLKIRATQLTNRDKSKMSVYHLYFKKGVGKVAAEGNGKLMTYLTKSKIK